MTGGHAAQSPLSAWLGTRQALLVLLLVVAGGFLAYANSFQAAFHQEDIRLMLSEPPITDLPATLGALHAMRHPLSVLSLSVNARLGGHRVEGYHLVNLILHCSTAFMLFLLVRAAYAGRVRASGWVGGLAAMLFVLHPIQTEAVTYISKRFILFAALFGLLSMWSFLKWRRSEGRRWGWLTVALGAWLCCLGSDVRSGLVLPLYFGLAEWGLVRTSSRWFSKRRAWLALLVLAGVALLVLAGMNVFDPLIEGYSRLPSSLWERILTEARVFWYAASLIIVPLPARQSFDPVFGISRSILSPPITLLAVALLGGLAAVVFLCARKDRVTAFFMLWFIGFFLLDAILPGPVFFEHRLYMSSVGLIVPAARVARAGFRRRGMARRKAEFVGGVVMWGALLVLLTSLALGTSMRNRVWATEAALWSDVLQKNPLNVRALNNLGRARFERATDIDDEARREALLTEAEDLFRRAIYLQYGSPEAHYNLASVLIEKGRYGEAENELLVALRFQPDSVPAIYDLAQIYIKDTKVDRAIQLLEQLHQRGVEVGQADVQLAALYRHEERYAEARTILDRVLAKAPQDAGAHYERGMLLLDQGAFEEAEQALRRVISIDPDDYRPYFNLALLYKKQNRLDDEEEMLRQYLAMQPRSADGHFFLGELYRARGELRKALRAYRTALQLSPREPWIRDHIDAVREQLDGGEAEP